jgi:hypothetical protein
MWWLKGWIGFLWWNLCWKTMDNQIVSDSWEYFRSYANHLESMLENPWIIKSSVTVGNISDHMPIILNISKGGLKPPSPLKFNHDWLKESDFKKLIENEWTHLKDLSDAFICNKWLSNMEKFKQVSRIWSRNFNRKNLALLREVEGRLANLLISKPIDSFQRRKCHN